MYVQSEGRRVVRTMPSLTYVLFEREKIISEGEGRGKCCVIQDASKPKKRKPEDTKSEDNGKNNKKIRDASSKTEPPTRHLLRQQPEGSSGRS
jgi:hypothetical protein